MKRHFTRFIAWLRKLLGLTPEPKIMLRKYANSVHVRTPWGQQIKVKQDKAALPKKLRRQISDDDREAARLRALMAEKRREQA